MGARMLRQVEAFTAEEMKGRPCVFDWVHREKQDLERVSEELFKAGWMVGLHPHGWYVAIRRTLTKEVTVQAITPGGLVQAVERYSRRSRRRRVAATGKRGSRRPGPA